MFRRGFKTWCENISAQFRRRLGLNPWDPVDSWSIAKSLSMMVLTPKQITGLDRKSLSVLTEEDPNSWSACTITLNGRDLVILNSSHSKARQSSDLAHELSHKILDHKPANTSFSNDGLLLLSFYDKNQEEEAGWLAGCILLPRDSILHIRKRSIPLQSAATSYGVSPKMLKYRLQVTGVDYQTGHKKRRK